VEHQTATDAAIRESAVPTGLVDFSQLASQP